MEIQQIKEMPTCIDKKHESVLRSYHTARKIMEMVERGDSKETIKEIFNFLND